MELFQLDFHIESLIMLRKLANEVRRKNEKIDHLNSELQRAEKDLLNLQETIAREGGTGKAKEREIDRLKERNRELEKIISKIKQDMKTLSDTRDMYKKELDNLTFEYDKLNRETRKAREDKIKFEKKLKLNMVEYAHLQEQKAELEQESREFEKEILRIRTTAKKEVHEMSEVKIRLEKELYVQQHKTAQIIIDYDSHHKLIKLAGMN